MYKEFVVREEKTSADANCITEIKGIASNLNLLATSLGRKIKYNIGSRKFTHKFSIFAIKFNEKYVVIDSGFLAGGKKNIYLIPYDLKIKKDLLKLFKSTKDKDDTEEINKLIEIWEKKCLKKEAKNEL